VVVSSFNCCGLSKEMTYLANLAGEISIRLEQRFNSDVGEERMTLVNYVEATVGPPHI